MVQATDILTNRAGDSYDDKISTRLHCENKFGYTSKTPDTNDVWLKVRWENITHGCTLYCTFVNEGNQTIEQSRTPVASAGLPTNPVKNLKARMVLIPFEDIIATLKRRNSARPPM